MMFQHPSLHQCILSPLISHFPSPSIILWQMPLSLPTFLFLSSQGGLFWGGIFCFVLLSNFPATPSTPTFFVSCYASDHSEQFHIMSNHINAYKIKRKAQWNPHGLLCFMNMSPGQELGPMASLKTPLLSEYFTEFLGGKQTNKQDLHIDQINFVFLTLQK